MGLMCCKVVPVQDPGSLRYNQDPGAQRYNKDPGAKKDKRKRLKGKVLAKPLPRTEAEAAGRIQAWWRGTLVRRTLLVAALRAWMIQVWWRALLRRRVQKFRNTLLKVYVVQEQAAVRLQSCVRMCRCHQRYSQGRGTLHLLQAPRLYLPVQAQPAGSAKGLEFHVEILSI